MLETVEPHIEWAAHQIEALFDLPFSDLLYRAQRVHRKHFDPNVVQTSTLLSIKTGGCSEDCGYCSQSKRHHEAIRNGDAAPPLGQQKVKLEIGRDSELMSVDDVVSAAREARDAGASRFCMGAAWRGPKDRDLDRVEKMVRQVKALGLETCVTLGMLREGQAERLRAAGLDYYNHNLDTAEDYYGEIITTHGYRDRIDTLDKVRKAGIKLCAGGIVGMGEERAHRAALIAQLANLTPPPESVPINLLVPIPGTPLADTEPLDHFEFIRTIAVARITMPTSFVRLSAGRDNLPEAVQALCFLAGANSIFYGDRLLTTGNVNTDADDRLFRKLGLRMLELG